MEKQLSVSGNPHIRHADTAQGIMLDVILALLPATAGGIWLFGWVAALVILASVASAVASEYLFCLIVKKPNPIADLSAVVTGLLLALNLPATLHSIWLGALGSAIAIVVVKQCFGGIGQNFANPAITARIVLLVSFPALMTRWVTPGSWLKGVEVITSATPLPYFADPAAYPDVTYSLRSLFLGNTPGCIGETSVLLLLVGGLYLVIRKVISPIIPVVFVLTAGGLSWLLGADFLVSICSGGLMLGAVFMATDYSTSPTHPLGKVVFAAGCGILTALIRRFGSLAEGVSYSILLMNLLVPLINRMTPVKPFGWEAKRDGK